MKLLRFIALVLLIPVGCAHATRSAILSGWCWCLGNATTPYVPLANQIKHPRTFNQITRSKPPWIGQKTMQPFQASLLNPNRRATLFSRKKVD
jgi:hypothetical protein